VESDIIIRKERVKIRTDDVQLALRARQHFNDALQYDLIRILEKVFSQFSFPDGYTNISKISIDLGILTAQDFEQDFLRLFESKLISELRKYVVKQGDYIDTELKHRNEQNTRDSFSDTPAIYHSRKQQQFAALMYFIQNGIFPWWYKKDLQTPEELLDNLTEEETKALLLKILTLPETDADAARRKVCDRIFIHLPAGKHEKLILALVALRHSDELTASSNTLINNKSSLTQLFSISVKDLHKQLFYFFSVNKATGNSNVVVEFFSFLKEARNISLPILINKLETVIVDDLEFKDELKKFTKPGAEIKSGVAAAERRPGAEKENGPVRYHQEGLSAKNKPKHKPKYTPAQPEEEGIYVNNAGLVLLHPFLPVFFTKLELLNDMQQFVSVSAQQKAAVLLYYLQCNKEQYKEWEMALNKIICGIVSDDVLSEDIVLSEKEKDECQALLQTVADYWEALKGASTEALQNTFILREGKISWKEDYWLLQIERTAVDILLERLPWGFATIKLPWLNHLIYTEW